MRTTSGVFKTPLQDHVGTTLTPIADHLQHRDRHARPVGRVRRPLDGTRRAAQGDVLAAICWSTGFVVAALGVATGQLWIVYLGYGVFNTVKSVIDLFAG